MMTNEVMAAARLTGSAPIGKAAPDQELPRHGSSSLRRCGRRSHSGILAPGHRARILRAGIVGVPAMELLPFATIILTSLIAAAVALP
jgi:hypothetical protein